MTRNARGSRHLFLRIFTVLSCCLTSESLYSSAKPNTPSHHCHLKSLKLCTKCYVYTPQNFLLVRLLQKSVIIHAKSRMFQVKVRNTHVTCPISDLNPFGPSQTLLCHKTLSGVKIKVRTLVVQLFNCVINMSCSSA